MNANRALSHRHLGIFVLGCLWALDSAYSQDLTQITPSNGGTNLLRGHLFQMSAGELIDSNVPIAGTNSDPVYAYWKSTTFGGMLGGLGGSFPIQNGHTYTLLVSVSGPDPTVQAQLLFYDYYVSTSPPPHVLPQMAPYVTGSFQRYTLSYTATQNSTMLVGLYVPRFGVGNFTDAIVNFTNVVAYDNANPPPPIEPPTVETLPVSDFAHQVATLNGTVNPNGVATIAGFEYGLTPQYGSLEYVALSPNTSTTTQPISVPLTGLRPGTTYHYRAFAINDAGRTDGADMAFTTFSGPYVVTKPASDLSILKPVATLNADVNPNGDSTVAYFEYGTTTDYGTVEFVTLNPDNSTSFQSVSLPISGLAPGTKYHYRIVGRNSGGTTFGDDEDFITGSTGTMFRFSSPSYIVSSSALDATVTVDCVGGNLFDTSVNCSTSDGTAKAYDDYLPISDTLFWLAGQSDPQPSQKIRILSPIHEGPRDKTLNLTLSDPRGGATLGSPSEATLTIVNVSKGPVLSAVLLRGAGADKMSLQGFGEPDATYRIESSPDLSPNSFTTLATVTADSVGTFRYEDPIIGDRKFYRIASP